MSTTAEQSTDQTAHDFIERWRGVNASELSTSQSFLIELCQLLGVDTPHPTPAQDYMFERPITFQHGDGSRSAGRIDLYRRGAFVLESKKLKSGAHTKGFDEAMLRARSQAENYARALPAEEGRPPFVLVVDVGQRIELYSEFSRSGGTYTPFPDPRHYRIALDDLADPAIRARLRAIWLDPLSLDPSRESARVTREIAARLAELAKSLEHSGHPAEAVAQFLMRCLFTMFAEDVRLLPPDALRNLLITHREKPDTAMRMLAQLWRDMDSGGFSAVLADDVLRFNGKLFKQPDTLPLTTAQIDLLTEAAKADWQHVEPAIFGTLLERALNPKERHKLGAHYTPRAYVERLVLPTVIEPLRQEWGQAHVAALALASEGKEKEAINQLLRFHHRLCNVRVLDPACGSGNFLYVTLEHLKRLEGEVLNALDEMGYRQTGLALAGERADAAAGETVDPHNLLGIELNPRAAAIAEVVLWIGYLQWHFRTRGDVNPPVPVIRDFRNIENRDAVLAFERVDYVLDDTGKPVTRWDGQTYKTSPITGEPIPDETARVPLEQYINPNKAEWPQADFVVGNPPYLGARTIRASLGDGYLDAIRSVYPDVPDNADFVMYWWDKSAELVNSGSLAGFGLITTNSIRQEFSRKVLNKHFAENAKFGIRFCIPDHPWVDSSNGAAVRVALTMANASGADGLLAVVENESPGQDDEVEVTLRKTRGLITPSLTVGHDLGTCSSLLANTKLACVGYQLTGKGFVVDTATAESLDRDFAKGSRWIRPLVSGRDIVQYSRDLYAIDLFGLSEEQLRTQQPALYQWVFTRVKPERDLNRDAPSRQNWWLFARSREEFRPALTTISRAIVTSLTSKHRTFVFVDAKAVCDSTTVMFALEDAMALGILSSSVHITWALAVGGRLGVGNDPRYNKSRCFEPFPFPDLPSPPAPLPPGEGLGVRAKKPLPSETLAFARQLRQQATDAENKLWMLLRDRRLHGMKFRRQHPCPPYTLDFYCHELSLAVELDGSQHLDSARDARRDAYLAEKGIKTLRYWNHDVLARTETVLEDLWGKIDELLMEKDPSALTPDPSPEGRGEEDAPSSPALPGGEGNLKPSPPGRGLGEGNMVERIRTLAEQLDAHRKQQQALHPGLTLTGIYNVLEKLRSGEPLTAKERIVHEQGVVSVLRQLHDELDAAVLAAYGWSDLLPLLRVAHGNDTPAENQTRAEAKRAFDEAVLERLVALNSQRAAEEAQGHICWLRPKLQDPGAQTTLATGEAGKIETSPETDTAKAAQTVALPWPKDPVEQVQAILQVLGESPAPQTCEQITQRFKGRGSWRKQLPSLLTMLTALGHISEENGHYRVEGR